MAHVHTDVPAADRPIGRHPPAPDLVRDGWIRVPLGALEAPGRVEPGQLLRNRPSKHEYVGGKGVDPALVGIAAAFLGMVALGILGKGLAGVLFWLL